MHRPSALALIPVIGLAAAAVAMMQTASAATFTVDRIDFDEGDVAPGDGVCAMSPANGGGCTLRAAMMEANLTPEADVINLPASTAESPIFVRRLRNPQGQGFPFQEFDELEGDIEITGSVTIRGINPSDPAATVISGRGRGEGFDPAIFDRIFQISPKFGPVAAAPLDVIIEGVTIANGRTEVENWGGGAILVFSQSTFGPNPISPPKLTLRNVVFRNNYSAISGGALSNYGGSVDIDNVIFEGNANSYTPNFTGAQNTQQPVLFLSGGQGGTLANWAGDLTMRNSVISGSYSQAGGAIYAQDASNIPTLTVIENSVIRGNFGFMGAAIFNMSRGTWEFGTATLVQHGMVLNRVTIETNEAEFAGGAIYNIGTILLSNCVVSSNRAWDAPGNPTYPNKGGGIYNSGRVLDIQSSTIAGNDAEEPRLIAASSDDSRGGDEIYLDHTNNIGQRGFRVAFTNAIVGDNLIGLPNDPAPGVTDDCAGPNGYGSYLSSQGGNLYRDNTCAPAPAAANVQALADGDKVGLDPMIEPLAANNAIPIAGGEIVKTMALKPGSPAIGNGIAALCPGSDARNFERVGACDSGAFQQNVNASANGNRAPAALADTASTNAGTAVTIKVLANDSDPDAVNRVKQLALAPNAIRQPANGAVVVASNSSVVYTPTAGFTGTDQFGYSVTDGTAQSEANVTVSVYDPATANTPPKGIPDVQEINLPDPAVSGSSAPAATISIDVLANDSDTDAGDTLRIERVRGPTPPINGVELIAPQQQGPGAPVWTGVNVRVNGGVSGAANFEYDLIDNRGAVTNNVSVTLKINTLPAVLQSDIPKPVDVAAGQTVSGTIKASDRDGQPLRFTLLQAPASLIGTATVNEATGAYTFTASTLNGDGSFLVGVSDGSPPVSVPVGIKVIGGTDPVPTPGTGTTSPGPGTGTGGGGAVPPVQNNPGGGTANPPAPVSSTTPSNSDDGGGSVDPFWFGLLAGAGILRRYRRHRRTC